ncbi:uncharacterized protein [Typha latifolia]|uniref:uncharacterized protein n=1 Tax=Typha latifolia TaxID=4733 RepID=UPI003C2CF878
MYRRLSSAVGIRAHAFLCRFSHSLRSPIDPKLGFLREELQTLKPASSDAPERVREGSSGVKGGGGGDKQGGREVEISHPWPEWVELMDFLLKKGYLDRSASRNDPWGGSKDSNLIRSACLNFGRDRFDLIRYLSRIDIQIVVRCGCPSIDRKVVNSGKRLRAHVGVEEGDVCSSCSFRERCERAYVKPCEDEDGRTVDVMRILLTYGLDIVTGSVENQACLGKVVKRSVRKLLKEIVEFSVKDIGSNSPTTVSGMSLSRPGDLNRHQMFKGQPLVPMKQGDWICPKCNFLNFAKNIKCLRCNGEFQERYKMLHEDQRHLPLKKGDWICEKCNFLNFAKNTNCLQCHEKPPKRHLNPGEWECVSCNYINFRRNMVCLKCDWKRPKALNSQDISSSLRDDQSHCKNNTISFVRDSSKPNRQHFAQRKSATLEEDSDLWSSEEDDDINNLDKWNNSVEFDEFPIMGGTSAVSQDPLVRAKWKEEMLKNSKRFSREGTEERNEAFDPMRPKISVELDDSSDDDEIATWFLGGKDRRIEKFS